MGLLVVPSMYLLVISLIAKYFFYPFFSEKKIDTELGGSKISHGLFKIQQVKIIKKIVNDPLTWSLGRSVGLSIK